MPAYSGDPLQLVVGEATFHLATASGSAHVKESGYSYLEEDYAVFTNDDENCVQKYQLWVEDDAAGLHEETLEEAVAGGGILSDDGAFDLDVDHNDFW